MTYASGGSNGTSDVVFPAMTNVVWTLYQVDFSWSGLLALGSTLQVLDGTTIVYQLDADIALSSIVSIVFTQPIAATVGNALTVKVTPGGVGATSKVNAFALQS